MGRRHKAGIAAVALAGGALLALHAKHPAQSRKTPQIAPIAAVYSDTSNALLGVSGPQGVLLDKGYFVINYNPAWGSAFWVAERVTSGDLQVKANRKGVPFYADPDLPESLAVTPADYNKSGFDRGHLAPAGDMVRSKSAMKACFTMGNMHAQYPDLNRQSWRLLEEAVRDSVKAKGTAWIVTGQLVPASFPKWIGKTHRVAVPDESFKVVLLLDKEGNYSAFGALGENIKTGAAVVYVPVDSVEVLSGFDFFCNLPLEIQERVEK